MSCSIGANKKAPCSTEGDKVTMLGGHPVGRVPSLRGMPRDSHRLPKLLACLALALVLGGLTPAMGESHRPNILFIMADDVGQEVLGCYGGTSYETPEIDKLAANGTRFTHCYSLPVCHPTRVSLMTGRYPFRLGNVGWGNFPESEKANTVARHLQDAGYATAISGKWQLTLLKDNPQHPHELGFDEYSLFGWHEGPRYYDPLIWQNGNLRDDLEGKYGPDLYTEFLIDFMEQHQDEPFFAFYSMALCHAVADDFMPRPPHVPGKDRYQTYAEMVDSMDAHVGTLVKALDRLDLREETIIIFTGDNGTTSHIITHHESDGTLVRDSFVSKRGDTEIRGGKGELTDGGTNVPLIANWPDEIPKGKVVDDLIDFSDFFPTFLELADASLPTQPAIDGKSFAGRLEGRAHHTRDWAYAESGDTFWVRDRRWKLYNDGRLYDLTTDPHETMPLRKKALTGDAAEAYNKLNPVIQQLSH